VLNGETGQWPFLAAGVAALVPLAIAAPAQNRAFRDAVEAHNAALPRDAGATGPSAAPWIAAAPAPGGGWTAAAGARGTW